LFKEQLYQLQVEVVTASFSLLVMFLLPSNVAQHRVQFCLQCKHATGSYAAWHLNDCRPFSPGLWLSQMLPDLERCMVLFHLRCRISVCSFLNM